MIFLYIRFKLIPYDRKIAVVILIMLITYLSGLILPELSNFILDIIVRSLLMTAVYGSMIVLLKVSQDVDDIKTKVISILRSYFK